MAAPRYARNAGAAFSLKYHVLWCPKFRRPVLLPPVDARIKEMLHGIAYRVRHDDSRDGRYAEHVHVVVEAGPTMHVAEIAKRFKGATSRLLRQEVPGLRSRLPSLWSRSYFAVTVGAVSEAAIRRYTADRKGK
ncbi:MAG TPA: IS200/IS605 family transposase [Burkholderiales bacterium]|nr:IS200/IS605 family transposase [Burkholderiales bacterium]